MSPHLARAPAFDVRPLKKGACALVKASREMRESARFLPVLGGCVPEVDLKGEPRRLRVAPRYSAACEEGRRDERACGTLPKRRWRHQQRARRADGGALTASSGLTPEPPPSFVGSCVVGVGRGQQRPVWSEAREAATSGGNQSAHQGRTTQANFGAGRRRFGRASRPPALGVDTRADHPRCHRVAKSREREFSRRTTNSRRDRDAGTHTTVQNWLLN